MRGTHYVFQVAKDALLLLVVRHAVTDAESNLDDTSWRL
jgi:hypothetical protein